MKSVLIQFAGLALLVIGCNNGEQTPDAYGNFTATEILISSESTGKVLEKTFNEGEKVEKGAIIYIIDTIQNSLKRNEILARIRSVKSKAANLSAQIDVLKEQKKSLEMDLGRINSMFKAGAATQKQMDDLTNQIGVLEKQVEQVKTNFTSINAEADGLYASVAQIDDLIGRSTVKSPISGTILEMYAETGENVAIGKPLYKIADLSVMELKAYFSGNQVPQIKLGDTVKVHTDDGQGGLKNYKGKVSWISSEAEFTPKIIQTREERLDLVYAVKILVKNEGSIKINMPGEVVLGSENE